MKEKFCRLLAFAFLASPLSASAQSIVGDWQGNVFYPVGNSANSYGLQLDMVFQTETPASSGFSFMGELEVICTAVSAPKDCGTGGFHTFTGTLGSNDLLSFQTIGAFSGTGALLSGGNYLVGLGVDLGGTPIGFGAKLVSAPEIDLASAASGLTLLVGGLLVLRDRRKQSLAA
jgi:hypothetical protein